MHIWFICMAENELNISSRRQLTSLSPLVGENLYRKVGEICNISGFHFFPCSCAYWMKIGCHSIQHFRSNRGGTLSNKKPKMKKKGYTRNLETDGCNREM